MFFLNKHHQNERFLSPFLRPCVRSMTFSSFPPPPFWKSTANFPNTDKSISVLYEYRIFFKFEASTSTMFPIILLPLSGQYLVSTMERSIIVKCMKGMIFTKIFNTHQNVMNFKTSCSVSEWKSCSKEYVAYLLPFGSFGSHNN